MTRKIFALLAALAMALSLAACQPEAPASSSTTTPPLLASCDHKDADKNNYCDLCEGSVLVALDFYALNDLHGRIQDTEEQPGVDELSTYLTGTDPETTVLLSSGDMWQGSFESSLTHGALMTEWMNEMGFASMTLGNHEFDWGASYIASNAELADFPFLAINIFDKTTNALVDYCQPSVMVERCGIQIGIIGAIGDVYSSISGEFTKDIYFKTGDALDTLIREESQRLRAEGADIIVLSHHSGSTSYALSDGYVDLVFEGHTHNSYHKQDLYGIYHIQGGAENEGISHAQVSYNIANDEIIGTKAEIIPSSIYEKAEDHPVVDQLMVKYQDKISCGYEELGTASTYISNTDIAHLVAQLYYEKGLERWGSEYDIVLGGGHIATRKPYDLEPGIVTYADLYALLPFDNQLALCSVRGSDLKEKFFETTNRKYAIYYETYGQSVYENIDPNGIYYIIVDSYTSSYAPNRLTEIERYDPNVYPRDLLADYIAAGGLAEDIPAPTDIPTLLEIGNALKPGETTQESYCVKGTVISVENTTYGNIYIQDEAGNTLYIYGVYDATGSDRYDKMENPPQVGDEVLLCGKIQHYVSKSGEKIIEMVYARKMN